MDHGALQLTIEVAKQIIEAFGPCTSLYECTTPEELVEKAQAPWVNSLPELIDGLLRSEEVFLERSREVESMRDGAEGFMQDISREHDEMMAGVRERLQRAGFLA